MNSDYLERILTARVYDVAQESPLEYAPNLSARLHNKIPRGSFEIAGCLALDRYA